MTLLKWRVLVAIVIGVLLSTIVGQAQETTTPLPSSDDPNIKSSERHSPSPIEKLIAQRCLSCHSGTEPEGGIDLTRPSAVARNTEGIADLESSLLWQVIEDDEMPPDNPLSDDERGIVHRWIVDGAPDDFEPIDVFLFSTDQRAGYDWWSLQPIQNPAIPRVADVSRKKTPIDSFVVDELERHSL